MPRRAAQPLRGARPVGRDSVVPEVLRRRARAHVLDLGRGQLFHQPPARCTRARPSDGKSRAKSRLRSCARRRLRVLGSRTRRTRRRTPSASRASAARSRPKAGACRAAGSRPARARRGTGTPAVRSCSSRRAERASKCAAQRCASSRRARLTTRRRTSEHWHGATPDSEFTQGALTHGDAAETAWLEQVSDAQYSGR